MQGYILNLTPVRDEDLIVTILTPSRLHTLYRFYGARHSPINLGYKIDFTIEPQVGYMDRLRNVLHLSFPWLMEFEKVMAWQHFIKSLHRHLKDIETIDPFYFDLLERLVVKLRRQHPKRAIVEGYTELLEHEGRLHAQPICFACDEEIEKDPVIVRGFLQAHRGCVKDLPIGKKGLRHLFRFKDGQYLADEEIELLYRRICEGL